MTGLVLSCVLAFGSPGDFAAPATLGGGSGGRFTGSPNEKWDCSVCHVTPTPSTFTLTAEGRDLVAQGYVPGETYDLELQSSAPGKRNAFALEFVTRTGVRAGTVSNALPLMDAAQVEYLCSGVDPVEVFEERVAQSYACAVSKWRLRWTAPSEDVGGVSLFVSVVDGDSDSTNHGDVTTNRLLGIPSPSTVGQRAASCSAVPGNLLAVLLVLLAGPSFAKKKKVAAPRAPVEVPAEPSAPPPAPAAAPAVERAPPTPTPTPAPPSPPMAAVAAPAPQTDVPAALELEARLGFGYRSFSLSSASYATPFRVGFASFGGAVSLTAFPMRLLRTSVLEGLHAQATYAVGWAPQNLGLGSAQVLPSDFVLALGYRFGGAVVQVAPRATWRMLIGGVERNALFDDAFFQSVGGEVVATLQLGRVRVLVAPGAGAVLDAGEQATRAYGRHLGGLTFGGRAGASLALSKSVTLTLAYQLTVTRASLAGRGTRNLEALSFSDTIHGATLSVGLEQ